MSASPHAGRTRKAALLCLALVFAFSAWAPAASAVNAEDPLEQIEAGSAHTCAILESGSVRCWGYGGDGRLGYGNTSSIGDNEMPSSAGDVSLGLGRTADAIAAGNSHTCALLDDGSVRCWGYNWAGQLGYGNTAQIGDNETPSTAGPVDLGSGRTAVSISAGSSHTCAILDDGSLRCWGYNGNGELGLGNTANIGDNEAPGSVSAVNLGTGRTALAVAAGDNHTCALLDNGNVRCWGYNGYGQLGYGNTDSIGDTESPASVGVVDLGSGRTAVAIGAGGIQTCALLDDGNVRCWGYGGDGRLGYGNTTHIGDNELPSSVGTISLGSGRTAAGLSVGGTFACALLDDGTVRCWGYNGYGQLGLARTDNIGDNELPSSVATVDLGAGRTGAAVTTGQYHTCAALDDGGVRCWGLGADGRLGRGNADYIGDNETPGSVSAITLGGLVDASSGPRISASTPAAPANANTPKLSGRADSGSTVSIYTDSACTGDVAATGSAADFADPGLEVSVADDTSTDFYVQATDSGDELSRCSRKFTYVEDSTAPDAPAVSATDPATTGSPSTIQVKGSAESGSTVALYTDDECSGAPAGSGSAATFADDGIEATVGEESTTTFYATATDAAGNVSGCSSTSATYLHDPAVPGTGGGASGGQIAGGYPFTCAILEDGNVRCWGYAGNGELGYGNTNSIGDNENPSSAGPVSLGAGRTATMLAAGGNHACALLDDGNVRCWGYGGEGRLGYANTNSIGDNELPSSAGPVNLGTGRTAVGIAAGNAHSCAILDNGSVRCWGSNGNGQLGLGNTNTVGDNETPGSVAAVDLGSGRTAVAIDSAGSHTCAVLDDGNVRCWGYNGYGQLGYGNTTQIGDNESPASAGPVSLGSGRTAVSIAVGDIHSCAQLDNGSVRCWGYGGDGRLGYANANHIGDNEGPSTAGPVDLGSGRTAVSLWAGMNHTCAVLDDGSLRCWGYNGYGNLGYGHTNPIGDNETPASAGAVSLGAGRTAVQVGGGWYHTCAALDDGGLRCWGIGDHGQLGYANTNRIGDNELPSSVGTVSLGGAVSGGGGGGAGTATPSVSSTVPASPANENSPKFRGSAASDSTVRLYSTSTCTSASVVAIGSAADFASTGLTVEVGNDSSTTLYATARKDGFTSRCSSSSVTYVEDSTDPNAPTVTTTDPANSGSQSAVKVKGSAEAGSTVKLYTDDACAGAAAGSGSAGTFAAEGVEATVAEESSTTFYATATDAAGNASDCSSTSAGYVHDPAVPGTGGGASGGQVAGGETHTCAILESGSVRCWGRPYEGQLGYGNTNQIGDNESPSSAGVVSLGAGRTATSISAGLFHTCAVLDDGNVRCWGYNGYGHLGLARTDNIGDNELPSSVSTVALGAGRTAVSVAAGREHTCALLDDGNVRCWGRNSEGQLGYGNTNPIGDNETPASAGPVSLGAGRTAVAIAAGNYHTCAVLDDGSARCWGYNWAGQLGLARTDNIGDGELPSSVSPVSLGGGRTVVSIDAGDSHTCAVLDDASIRCWGYADYGQLGYGNQTRIGDNESPSSVGAVSLGAGRTATSVAAGYHHTCAVLDDATVRCWGRSFEGQLGYGNTTHIGDNELPSSVGTVGLGTGRTATSVADGFFHTCATLDDATLRCWGYNNYGQLGLARTDNIGDGELPASVSAVNLGDEVSTSGGGGGGTARPSLTSTVPASPANDNSPKVKGSAASGSTVRLYTNALCASESVVAIGSAADFAGSGLTVEVADGTSTTLYATARKNGFTSRCSSSSVTYIEDSTAPDAPTVSATVPAATGSQSAIKVKGSAEAGSTVKLYTDDACSGSVAGSGSAAAFAADGVAATVEEDSTTSFYATATDAAGNASGCSSTSATYLHDPAVPGTGGGSGGQIDGGEQHTCALLDDGNVRCWGYNGYGQLGYGNTNAIGDNEAPSTAGPVNLGSGRTATALATGGYHSCALLDDGNVRCWGRNSEGQLGLGNTNQVGDNELPSSVPVVSLGTGRTAVAISAGFYDTCAILDDGSVRCWGSNWAGQLGLSRTDNIGDNESPSSVGVVNLGMGRTAVAIAAHYEHTCAVLDDGSVRCWGNGNYGRLGYGNTTNIGDNEVPGSVGPVNLGAGRTAVGIATGELFTCALLDDGNVRCWGYPHQGQLGYGNLNQIGDDEVPGSVGPVSLGTGRTATAISTGSYHACATLDDGNVRCWGYNAQGQLGLGHTTAIGDNELPSTAGPVSLGTGRTASGVATGFWHTCAVLDDGSVRCWGQADSGRLGYGNTTYIGDNELPSSVGTLSLGGTVSGGSGGGGTAKPTVTSVSPASPANDNSPKVKGSAAANSTVRIYTSSTCESASVVGIGSASDFAGTGVAVSLGDNTNSTLYATARKNGFTSPCSTTFAAYLEDSVGPATDITAGPDAQTASPSAELTFTVDDPAPSAGLGADDAECRLDSSDEGDWAACDSPKTYSDLDEGPHRFEVRGKDVLGNVDASPAVHEWTVTSTVETVGEGGTVSTGDEATEEDPIEASVTTPTGGEVTITENDPDVPRQQAPDGYEFFGHEVHVDAPDAPDADNPIVLVFTADSSIVPPGVTEDTVQIFHYEDRLPDCQEAGVANPDPCVASREELPDGDLRVTVLTTTTSPFNFGFDTAAPVTTDDVDADWHPAPVEVTLTAGDDGGSGVAATHYATGESPADPTTASPAYDPDDKPTLGHGEVIKYFSVDNVGNEETVKTSSAAKVDEAKPLVDVTGFPTALTDGDPDPSFTYTVSDELSGLDTVTCVLKRGATTVDTDSDCAEDSPKSYPGLVSDANYQWTITATDVAGNTESVTKTFDLDNRDPDVVIKSPKPATNSGPAGTLHMEFGDATWSSGIASVECKLEKPGSPQPLQPCVFDSESTDGGVTTATKDYSGLTSGEWTFTLKVTDTAGNVGQGSHTWWLDTIKPTVEITDQPAGPTNQTAATFKFDADDEEPSSGGFAFKCQLDGGSWQACGDAAAGVTVTKGYTVAEGQHTFKVTSTDNAGNESDPDVHTWVVDTTRPVVTVGFPTQGGMYSIDSPKPHIADYSCVDPVSGGVSSGIVPGSCAGPVADGAAIDRGSQGAKDFKVNASDEAGNQAIEVNNNYTVSTFAGIVGASDPDGYYRLGETSGGTVVDASGNGLSGEYKNKQSSGPEGISGDDDFARAFFGEDGYGFINGLTATQSYTLGGFFKLDDLEDQALLHKGSAGALWLQGGKFHFRAVDWNANSEVVSTTVPNTTSWYQVLGRVGQGKIQLWVNGVNEAERSGTGPTDSSSSTFYIGYATGQIPAGPSPAFHGSIDEVAIFPSALSETRIKEIYLADPPPKNARKPGERGDPAPDVPASPESGDTRSGAEAPGPGTEASETVEAQADGAEAELAPESAPAPPASPAGTWLRENRTLLEIVAKRGKWLGKTRTAAKRCALKRGVKTITLKSRSRGGYAGQIVDAVAKKGKCRTRKAPFTATLSDDGGTLKLVKRIGKRRVKEELTRSKA